MSKNKFVVLKSNCAYMFSFFTSVPRRLGRRGDMRDDSAEILPISSAGGPCEQFWHRQGCPLFDVVHPAFPLPTTASPALRGVLKDGFGEAVVAFDMPEPFKISLSSQLPEKVSLDPEGS